MGLPRITYNSKTIDFGIAPTTIDLMQPEGMAVRNWNYDHTVSETLILPHTGLLHFEWPVLTALEHPHSGADRALRRNLDQWRVWALRGGAWTFARDSAHAVNTTLNGAVSAGDQSATLTSAAGVVAGSRYVIRTPTSLDIVEVEAIDGAVVWFAETLNYAFATGSVFRSEMFWNAHLDGPDGAVFRDLLPRAPYYSFSLTFSEVLA